MNRKKLDDEKRDGYERMQILPFEIRVRPCNQFRHQARRVERFCRRENDTETFSVRAEGFNMIVACLVLAAMSLVFR